jgi:hypothetical protein
MRRFAVAVWAIVLLAGLAAPPASAQTDAVSVARALINAENAHDVNAAVNFFAPGAIVNLPTGVFVTRAEIEQWQRELAAGNFRADITPPVAVTPEVVTFSGTVGLDLFRQLGISPLDATWQLTIQLGKVTTFNFNFTPAATARLGAALAGGGGGAASSGGGGAASSGGGASGQSGSTASAGRSLALTGADVRVAGVAMLAIVLGSLLLVTGRRQRRAA